MTMTTTICRGSSNVAVSGVVMNVYVTNRENLMKLIAQSTDELTAILRRGLSPLTDNRDALLALGFERAYPQARTGRDATIWERTINNHRRPDGYRVLARERAFLVAAAIEQKNS
jgi:hypothetical protein